MIVVDTSVWIEALRGETSMTTRKLRRIVDQTPDDILVGDLVLLEVLQGARDEAHATFLEARLRMFVVETMLDASLASAAARQFRVLRGHGVTLRKTADLIIATFCIERGHALLHRDRDFEGPARHLGLLTI